MATWHNEDELSIRLQVNKESTLGKIAKIECLLEDLTNEIHSLRRSITLRENTIEEPTK